jgi:penicillin amidase
MGLPMVKSWLKRLVLGLLALLLVAVLGLWFFLRGSLPQLDGRRNASGLSANVTVVRDAQGVPSISGGDRHDVAYATGFVHAQDRFFQMDLLRRMPAGELSELFGEKAVEIDRIRRLHRFRARAVQAVQAMAADDRRLLERYVAGVNDGLNALGNRPFEYGLVGVGPRPWALEDCLLVAWAMYIDLQETGIGRELARGWLKEHASQEQLAFLLPSSTQWDAPLDAPSPGAPDAPIPARAPDWWGKGVAKEPATLAAAAFVDGVGSNNWAVAGRRSRSGGAIVSDDMHLGIKLPSTWYRLLLQVPGQHGSTRRIVGVSIPGTPAVVAGSNGHVAWGFTNSYGDYIDLIEVASAKERPGQLKLPGGWETPVVYEEDILVKGMPAVRMKIRETSLGPVMLSGGREYAVHWVAHDPKAVNLSLRQMEGVDTVAEALALAPKVGMPAQNLVVGDSGGNIGWTISGPLPQRPAMPVDASFPLPANASTRGWEGLLPAAAYPSISNPADGQLVTANSRQLMGADAVKLGDGGFDLGARATQARDGLAALGDKTDEQGVYNVMLDDRALFIAQWRARALAVLDAQAVQGRPQRAELARLLKENWNGHASVDSVAYRASRAFMWSLYELLYGGANIELAKLNKDATMRAASSRWPVVLARLLDEQPGGWLPAGHASWKALQLAALDRAIAHLTKDGKPLAAATWGARNTAAITHPIAGALPMLKKWLSVPPDQLPGDSNMPRVAGPAFGQSERMTVSPGREEQGLFNMPGGQSGHPLSPFYLAGHADWVSGKAAPLLPGPASHSLTFFK